MGNIHLTETNSNISFFFRQLAQVDNLYFQYDICIIFQQVAKGSHKIHGHFV